MQFYQFTLAANTAAGQPFPALGRWLRYESGSAGGADESLLVKAKGLTVILKPGQRVRFPDIAGTDSWRIENYAGAGIIAGIVSIGFADVEDSRISGTVSVVDGGRARSMAQQSFESFSSVAAVAAQYSLIQLWNPSATKRLMVQSVVVSSSVASPIAVYGSVSAIGVLDYTPTSKRIIAAASVASVAEQRTQNTAAPVTRERMMYADMAANSPFAWSPKNPIVIEPSTGIIVINNAVNSPLKATFEYDEEAI